MLHLRIGWMLNRPTPMTEAGPPCARAALGRGAATSVRVVSRFAPPRRQARGTPELLQSELYKIV